MNKNALIAIAVVVAGLALWLLYGVLSAPGPTAVKVPVPAEAGKKTSLLRHPYNNPPVAAISRSKAESEKVKSAVNVVSGNVSLGVSVGGKK